MLVGLRPTTSSSDKPKVPPPVPPRGTPKPQRGGGPQTNGNSKGKTDYLTYTNGKLLHDLLCLSVNLDSLSSSEGDFTTSQNYYLPENNNKCKLKRSVKNDKLIDIDKSRSPVQRSVSLIETNSDDFWLKGRPRSLPKCYKSKFSKLHDIDFITKSNTNIFSLSPENFMTTKFFESNQTFLKREETDPKEQFGAYKSEITYKSAENLNYYVENMKSISDLPRNDRKTGCLPMTTSSKVENKNPSKKQLGSYRLEIDSDSYETKDRLDKYCYNQSYDRSESFFQQPSTSKFHDQYFENRNLPNLNQTRFGDIDTQNEAQNYTKFELERDEKPSTSKMNFNFETREKDVSSSRILNKIEYPKRSKVAPNFCGTFTYVDEQKRYKNLPKIFVSTSSVEENVCPSLSPRRNYNVIFNSKRNSKVTKRYEQEDLDDLV